MTQVAKFLRLPSPERHLLLKAVFLLGGIKLGLSLLPFPVLRQLLTRARGVSGKGEHISRPSVERSGWAVMVAGRYVPRATCLAQALAVQVLLVQQGHVARLCIGVAKGPRGQLEAHAWVESQGRVVIGGPTCKRYTPLLTVEGRAS